MKFFARVRKRFTCSPENRDLPEICDSLQYKLCHKFGNEFAEEGLQQGSPLLFGGLEGFGPY